MSSHPAGVFNPLKPFRKGPPAPLYRSGITAPTRSVAFLAETQVDEIAQVERKAPVFQIGVFTGLYRRRVLATALTPTTLRFATIPLITSPDEDPPNVPITGSLTPIRVDRTVETVDQRFGPMARSTVGMIELRNADGSLDQLDAERAVVGRPIKVRVGTYRVGADGRTPIVDGTAINDVLATDSGDGLVLENGDRLAVDTTASVGVLSAFGGIFSGVVEAVDWGDGRVSITARDPGLVLERPVQRAVYSGSGGINGTPDHIGVSKPFALGYCPNAPLYLIDPVRLIYQYHAGEARGADAVRASGLPLANSGTVGSYAELAALEPPSSESDGDFPLGSFVDCPLAGCLRLANLPAGPVTADIRGAGFANSLREAFSDGTYFTDGTGWKSAGRKVHSRTVTQIMLRLFDEAAELGRDDVAFDQITQFGTLFPYEAGIFLPAGGQTTIAQCLSGLADSLGALLFRGKDGRYQLRSYQAPNEVPLLTIRRDMILPGTLQRIPLPYRQPWSDFEVTSTRNWSPLSDSDFVDAVSAEERSRMHREFLVSRAVNREAASLYRERAPVRVESYLTRSGEATAVARRLSEFYAPGRMMFDLRLKGVAYRLDLLHAVRIIHPRYGLAAGRNCVVLAVSEDGARRDTALRLFG